ncbi:MAG: hypothetical protein JSS39_01695 [Nitrospira sp.]|nr:hypothetical protein [Nitrospira sp.]
MHTAEATTRTWHELNQRRLMTEVARVRAAIAVYVASRSGHNAVEAHEPGEDLRESEVHHTAEPAALDALCVSFGLSAFERDVLLLVAGMELEAGFASACTAAQGDPRRAYPTFGLALALLPQAHWSAVLPTAPLRRWRLLEVGQGDTLMTSQLRIDERILHYLTGLSYVDERLVGLVDVIESESPHS